MDRAASAASRASGARPRLVCNRTPVALITGPIRVSTMLAQAGFGELFRVEILV